MIRSVLEYFRIPEDLLGEVFGTKPTNASGFFLFGPDSLCFGSCSAGVAANDEDAKSYNAFKHIKFEKSGIQLPFDPDQVIENIRLERYVSNLASWRDEIFSSTWSRDSYYLIRDLLPAKIRRQAQQAYFANWESRTFPAWPVDTTVDRLHQALLKLAMEAHAVRKVPFIWFWPDGAESCLILTHDIETKAGRDFTSQLMDLDEAYGFKASFQVVPEKRYEVPEAFVQEIGARGFEFNVHDLNHDGNLYRDHEEFLRRAKRINAYVRQYGAEGFRAGALYRNPEWYDAFEFSYDMSIPNVAHLEPQRGGCCSLLPFFIGEILELPLTTAEDYSVFHILNDFSIDLWKKQFQFIVQRHGLASFLTHPDYLIEERARRVYEMLLGYLRKTASQKKVWSALPGEVNQWWRARSQMKLVPFGKEWAIEGPRKERARLAYAVLDGQRLLYEIHGVPAVQGDH